LGRLAANKWRAASHVEYVPPKEKPCFPDGSKILPRETELSIYVTIIKRSKRQHVGDKKEVIHFIVSIITRKDGTRMMA
jgi:hypothetical protein